MNIVSSGLLWITIGLFVLAIWFLIQGYLYGIGYYNYKPNGTRDIRPKGDRYGFWVHSTGKAGIVIFAVAVISIWLLPYIHEHVG